MSRIRVWKRIALSAILALAVAALAWATPGSAFVTAAALVRSTAAVRINIKTHPNELMQNSARG